MLIPVNRVESTLAVAFTQGTSTEIELASVANCPAKSVVYIADGVEWCLVKYALVDSPKLKTLTNPLAVYQSSGANGHEFPIGTKVCIVAAADLVEQLLLKSATDKTISGGVISVDPTRRVAAYLVDTEGAAGTDDLDTINGGAEGMLILLRAKNAAHTVVVKHGTGNLLTNGADISLDDTDLYVLLAYDTALTKLVVVGGGGGGGDVTKVGTPVDNQVGVWTGDGTIEGDAGLTYASNLLTVKKDAIGVTQGDYGLALVNTTAAAAGAQQYGPPLRFRGYGWETDVGSSMSVDFRIFPRPIQGEAAPTGGLDFQVSIDGGAYVDLMTLLSNGNLDVFGTISANPGVNTRRYADTASWGPYISFIRYRGSEGSEDIVQSGDRVGSFNFMAYDGEVIGNYPARFGAIIDGTPGVDDTPGALFFSTCPDGARESLERMRIKPTGAVGILTTTPDGAFAINQTSGTCWADLWDTYSCAEIKEDIVEVGGGYLEKLRNVPAYSYRMIPGVSADELRKAAIAHFGPEKWQAEFGGTIVEYKHGTKQLEDDQYRGGKLRGITNPELLAFVDSTANGLREERRQLPRWQRKHLGLVADYPELEANWPEAVGYGNDGEILGTDLAGYIGVLHATMREMLGVIDDQQTRIEALETA